MANPGIILQEITISDTNKKVVPNISFENIKLIKKGQKLIANVELVINHKYKLVDDFTTLEKKEIFIKTVGGDITTGLKIDGDVINNKWEFKLLGAATRNRRLGDGILTLGIQASKVGPGSGVNLVAKKKVKKKAKK